MKKNRYRDGSPKLYICVSAAEPYDDAEPYGIVAELVADEIRDADAEVRNGGEDND